MFSRDVTLCLSSLLQIYLSENFYFHNITDKYDYFFIILMQLTTHKICTQKLHPTIKLKTK